MVDLPLYNTIKRYSKDMQAIFHMPGHKQNNEVFGKHLESILSLDVTEVLGTDNLHSPEGAILDAQKKAARLFSADATWFLVNGTTCGIQAMLLTVCNPGDEILVARNCHRSVFSGLVLVGAKPIYIYPDIHAELGILGSLSVKNVEEALKRYPKAKGLILTSPTYEGLCSDIQSIASLLHEKNKVLLVDEAHGAHFSFHEKYPKSSLEYGADLVVQSSHKTLAALTQSAMLHMKGNRIDKTRLQQMLAITQTSSPSYILLCGLDVCCEILEKEGHRLLGQLYENIVEFRDKMETLSLFNLIEERKISTQGTLYKDPTKLVIDVRKTGCTGKEIENILRNEYKIQMEMSTENYILGIATLGDEEQAFNHLFLALEEIESKLEGKDLDSKTYSFEPVADKIVCLPREAVFAEKEVINLYASKGRIAGEFIIPYPPGIPMLIPGEEITEEIIVRITALQQMGCSILGSHTKGNNIQVIK